MSTQHVSIKQKAHAFTAAAFCCLVISVPAYFGLVSGKTEVRAVSLAAITVELLLIAAAVFFWLREKPQEVRIGTNR